MYTLPTMLKREMPHQSVVATVTPVSFVLIQGDDLLIYLSTNEGKTGKSYKSVVHGLHAYVPVIAMPNRNLVPP